MARSPDDPYNRATPFGRKVYDSANSGGNYDHDWLEAELAKDAAQKTAKSTKAGASTFEQQYEELFGEKIEYDPIDVGGSSDPPSPRLDLTDELGAGGGDEFQSTLDGLYNSLRKQPKAAPPEDNAFGEDTLRALGAGTAQTGAMGAGALEYGARQAGQKLGPGVGQEILADVTAGLADLRQQMSGQASEWLQGMSPEAIDSMQRHILSLDPNQSIWRGGPGKALDAIAMKVTQSLPATILTLLPAARFFRAGMSPAAITYLGASEGGLSLGGIANNIAEEIENMTPEQLAQESERYGQLVNELGDPEQARQQLIAEAQGAAPLIGGIVVGAISSTAGRFLEPVFQKGAGLLTRTGTGFAEEAAQEAPQSGVEQYVSNIAAQIYDEDRGDFEGVGEASAEGALIGGVSGGGFSAIMGGGRDPQQAGPSTGDRAPDQPPPPESFERVFGKGGPEPFERVFGVEEIDNTGVSAEMRAALEEAGQQSLYLPQPGDLEAMGAQQGLPGMQQGPRREPVVRTPNPVAQPRGQQALPLQRRVRGGMEGVTPQPLNAVDYSPDMSQPPGVAQDPRQMDMMPSAQFDQGEARDVPSAEPVADLLAQLDEMDRPESDRQAVYLSAANIDSLQRNRELEPLLERGVVLADFDGKGGALIARDRQAADELIELRNRSAGNIQEVLGLATGAGTGKPVFEGEGVTVQRINEAGNVVQESLVRDDAEAEQLAAEWEQKYPNFETRVLSAPAAIGRRNRLLQQEQRKRVAGALREEKAQDIERTSQRVRQATSITPNEGPTTLLGSKATAQRVTKGATTPTKAAARLLGQATRESAQPEQRRIGGFYPPDALDFKNPAEALRYRTRFGKLTDRELELEQIDHEVEEIDSELEEIRDEAYVPAADEDSQSYRKARTGRINNLGKRRGDLAKRREGVSNTREELLGELAEIRTRAKPVRRASHLVAAAERLAPEAVKKVMGEASRNVKREPEDVDTETGASLGREIGAIDDSEMTDADLGALTDQQIERLHGEKLDTAFKRAANVISGRGSKLVYMGQNVNEETVRAEDSKRISGFYRSSEAGETGDTERVRAARAYEVMVKNLKSPSEKRKLVRRGRNMLKSREHGGGTQSKPITASSTTMKSRPDLHRRKGKFETQVLAAETLPQDESRGDRLKREASAKRSRERLDKTLRRGFAHLDKLSSDKYAELAQEKDGEELTDAAKDLILGRSYFRTLMAFGEALVKSGNTSETAVAEMEKLDEFLRNAIGMKPRDFARVFGNLLRAESHQQATELREFGDFKAKLADPEKRKKANADILRELMADTARRVRLEKVWRKNPYYMSIVEPLMLKITDSTFRDGWPSYKPTEEELVKLQWIMNNWRNPADLRERFYTPLRRFFTTAGYQWTPTKKDSKTGHYTGGELIVPYVESTSKGDKGRRFVGEGDAKKPIHYKYSPSDRALKPLYTRKFGAVDDLGTGLQLGGPQAFMKPQVVLPASARRGFVARPSRFEQLGRQLQANRVIRKFRDIIAKPKTTVAGMIRTEERLIRAFKELGMWTQTSPVLGTVQFEKPMSYRPVGPRLTSKELSKEEGRKLLLQQMKAQPVDIADEYQIARRLEDRPLRAETELFLERTADPGPAIEAFRATALRLNEVLDDSAHVHTLGNLLEIIKNGLPESHMFHNLATKLSEVGAISETPVSWDYRRQLSEKASGALKWEKDPRFPGGVLRYIILDRSKINARREPGAAMLHTLLHEAVHAATSGAVDRNKPVRDAFETLKLLAANFMHREGGMEFDAMPYGLQEQHNINEFVAEAFSNPRFQSMLKRIPLDYSMTLWGRFVELVKNILGVSADRPEPKNAFEAVMTLQNRIFTGELRRLGDIRVAGAKKNIENLELPDELLDNIKETGQTFKRAWARGLSPNAPLIMMTMRQIHKEFRRHFGVGKNPMDQYHENWERRNAENSRLMEQGEAVSREWSAATEKTSTAQALEFSRLITEATLNGVHPNRGVGAPGNEHLKLPEAKARHAELAARFNKLPAVWQDMYTRVQKYYTQTLEQETNLLMLNALRGTLASGDNAVMSRSEFDKRYTEDSVRAKKLGTKEGLEKEFGQLDKGMLRTLQEIASIPVKREGPYFPLMRYGNYVVYAQKSGEKKTFAESKDAYAYRAHKLAEDPTLDVGVRKTEAGFEVRVMERDFRTAETVTEAEKLKEEMIELYGRDAVTDVQLKDNFKAEETIQSGSALAGILTNLKGNQAAQNAIKNYWLRSLADKSFRKHQIRRKNRRGVDFDLQHRSFTNYVKQASYYISQLKYGWRMADAMRAIREFVRTSRDTKDISSLRLGQVKQELEKRDDMTSDLAEMPKAIRTATELGQLFMLFGPSYWLINLTQPYMVTVPWLGARYGWGGATAAMANAQRLIVSPILRAGKDSWGGVKAFMSKMAAEKAFNVLDQVKETIKDRGGERASAYIDMLEQLRQQSVIDLSWIAELRDISEGRSTSGYQRFMDATRVMAHLTEVNNRIITALAAYDLRYSEVMARQGATHELAHTAAIQTAKDAVAETQFDYSGGNKPRLFQQGGPAKQFAPLIFQFMQYAQHMYAMMISNFATAVRKGDMDRATAAKTLAGLFATHMAAAGVLGIALQPVKWAIGLMLMAFGDDDEPWTFANAASGENFDRWAREGLSDMMGNKLGSVVAQGLPELAGVRLTDRMALGTVYYLDLKTDTAESTIGSVAQGFMGPVLGYTFTGVRAGQFALEGEFGRALETLAPKSVRDAMRAYRFGTQGVLNNAGDRVIDAEDLSPWQLFLQATGFRPSEVADFYSKQALIKETEALGLDGRNALIARFRKAESIADRNAVLRQVAEHNKLFPAHAVTRSSLLRALTGKAEREASYETYGAALRGRSRLYAEEGEFYDSE